jgi:S-(hydroxymethyl)glutathione dehydrogenase/alcohol dehydrogenase
MGCAITTAFGLINNEAKLKMGQSIAVYGVGGVGLSIVQGASLVSAHPIIAIDKVDKKLEIAYNCGATHMLNTNVHDVEYEISRIVGKGVDVFVDCTGNVDLISKAYKMTDSIGKTILVGQPYCDDELIIPDMLRNYGGKQLFASQGGFTNPTEDIPRYCKLFKHNKISTVEIATHFFTLDEINDALDVVRSGEAGRCIITM